LTDTANTRVFNVGLRGARLKLVGGDSGHYEREELVESVLIAPSERAVVDGLLERPGELTLEHRTPHRTYPLVRIDVADEPAQPSLGDGDGRRRVARFGTGRAVAKRAAEDDRPAENERDAENQADLLHQVNFERPTA
jgi:hypothetical protein